MVFFRADGKGRFSPNRSDGGSIVDSVPAAALLVCPWRMDQGPVAGGAW